MDFPVGTDETFSYVLASFHTEWNEEDSRSWVENVRNAVGRRLKDRSGEFIIPTVGSCPQWNYDLVVFVDGSYAVDENGMSSGVTYGALMRRFMSETGWYQKTPGGRVIHVEPLAPRFAETAKLALRRIAARTLSGEIPTVVSRGVDSRNGIRAVLENAGDRTVEYLQNLIIGGISPLFSREISEYTKQARRARGIGQDNPLYASGNLCNHIHYAVRGNERSATAKASNVDPKAACGHSGGEVDDLVDRRTGRPGKRTIEKKCRRDVDDTFISGIAAGGTAAACPALRFFYGVGMMGEWAVKSAKRAFS